MKNNCWDNEPECLNAAWGQVLGWMRDMGLIPNQWPILKPSAPAPTERCSHVGGLERTEDKDLSFISQTGKHIFYKVSFLWPVPEANYVLPGHCWTQGHSRFRIVCE